MEGREWENDPHIGGQVASQANHLQGVLPPKRHR